MSDPAPNKRSEILESALRLFVDYGYDGVGVQQIVEAAGVTKPTLYHYFGSKLGLLEALLDERLEPLQRSLAVAATYRHDLTLTLQEVVRVFFSFARVRPDVYRLFLSLWFAPALSDAFQLARRYHERVFTHLETLFREAANDHGNMKGRHRAYAVTFLGMIHNVVLMGINQYATLDDALLYPSVHQFMHGIFS